MEINITKTIILTIVTTTTKIAISQGEKSVTFMAKKVVTLISIQMISNRKQKNFGDKTKNSAKIKANTTHF